MARCWVLNSDFWDMVSQLATASNPTWASEIQARASRSSAASLPWTAPPSCSPGDRASPPAPPISTPPLTCVSCGWLANQPVSQLASQLASHQKRQRQSRRRRRHLLLLDNATSSYTYDLEFAEYVNRYILYSYSRKANKLRAHTHTSRQYLYFPIYAI